MLRYLGNPTQVADAPRGNERGGVFDAPWVPRSYGAPGFPMPSNASLGPDMPPSVITQRVGYARLSAAGIGTYITQPIGPTPVRAIRQYTPPPTPTDHVPAREGIFSSPFLSPGIDAAAERDLPSGAPEWVENARLITKRAGVSGWPDTLRSDSIFRLRRA